MHEKWRFLYYIMAHIDNKVRSFNGAMHKVAVRKGRIPCKARIAFIEHALTHLRSHKRNAGFINKLSEHLRSEFAIGPCAY